MKKIFHNLQEFNLLKTLSNKINIFKSTLTSTISIFSIILTINLIMIAPALQAGSFKNQYLTKKVEEAELIIKGKLINKYARIENYELIFINKDGDVDSVIPNSIYTTFIFAVEKVLKGEYQKGQIEVKMIGGCIPSGECDKYSFNYNYDIDEKAVLFLTLYIKYNHYVVTQGANTAFYVLDDDTLISKSVGYIDRENYKSKSLKQDKDGNQVLNKNFTIDSLRQEIEKGVSNDL